jgi:hypothetical protein
MEATANAAGHSLIAGSSVDPAPYPGTMTAGANPGEVSDIFYFIPDLFYSLSKIDYHSQTNI